ncbi:ATP-binding cassette domain-containing protein [Vibrio sp. 10N]|uniref:ATP-binding cassette domain-containing protein n=1 Tax=Vibrio sp. 10N TaxID=3058938 RepID=UPI0028137EA2|nr:ATP-binding cassette domain-containing protein [Vibrio sp. 10N]
MTAIHAISLSKQFSDGQDLFNDLSFTIPCGVTALVGKNGCGKSHLASILAKQSQPTSGSVDWGSEVKSVGVYLQEGSSDDAECSIAAYLGVEHKLDALKQISEGATDSKWFDLIADSDWQLEQTLADVMETLRLPKDLNIPLSRLSGGQRAIIRLYRLLNQEHDAWILDEPTNHLDTKHIDWLVAMLRKRHAPILVISHNISFLNNTDRILELNSLGITSYGGGFQGFLKQKEEKIAAINKMAKTLEKARKVKVEKAQRRELTAQRLASRGEKQRASGSQPKILMDGKKQGAQLANSAVKAQNERQMAELDQKLQNVKSQLEQFKPQKWYTCEAQSAGRVKVHFEDFSHSLIESDAINGQIFSGEHVWLKGANGSGKSTLLRLIEERSSSSFSGHFTVNGECFYLDQHFSFLDAEVSMLDMVCHRCEALNIPKARTLLAGIGFRRESVHQSVSALSGGEKMKLAMLIASHQPYSSILLLDEPDNHLDLEAKQQLIGAINGYQGTAILVSHDEGFVGRLAIDRTIELS